MSRLLAASFALLLAACAVHSPPRTDPLADLVGNAKIVDSPMRVVADAKSKSLALIVSTSSETQIKHREEEDKKYLEGYIKSYKPGSYPAVKAQNDSVSPRKLIETVVIDLRPRFKSVTVVADLAEFRERNLDVAAVVDVGMEYNVGSSIAKNSGEYTTDVSLIMFDKQIRKIGVANGKATEYGERSNFGDIVGMSSPPPEEVMRPLVEAEIKSRANAFTRLNASLDQLVQK